MRLRETPYSLARLIESSPLAKLERISWFRFDSRLFTVVTSYYNFSSRFSRDWSLTSAAAVMMTLPILIIFLLLQRRFIAGLTQGGLKS